MTSTAVHPQLATTPLAAWHEAAGARMVDFAGWSMPVQYTSIVAEHIATRTAAGLFDISHMGRLRIGGRQAAEFLDHILTRRVMDMTPGRIRYALAVNEQGGVLDDVLVYRLTDKDAAGEVVPDAVHRDENAPDGATHQLVVNAGNRAKMLAWVQRRAARFDAAIVDVTLETAMIAVQGPRALEILQPLVDRDLAATGYYTGGPATVAGAPASISRTGYTGEDGCEVVVDSASAERVWQAIFAAGRDAGLLPAGLGCRDTLRLEAAMPLYGHELTEQINPVEAGLMFAVDLQGREFLGRQAIVRFQDDATLPRRVGLELAGKRVAREGSAVFAGERRVGEVTSGTFSPTLVRPIAMAYIEPSVAIAASEATQLEIDVRGRREPARIVPLPFYQRN